LLLKEKKRKGLLSERPIVGICIHGRGPVAFSHRPKRKRKGGVASDISLAAERRGDIELQRLGSRKRGYGYPGEHEEKEREEIRLPSLPRERKARGKKRRTRLFSMEEGKKKELADLVLVFQGGEGKTPKPRHKRKKSIVL